MYIHVNVYIKAFTSILNVTYYYVHYFHSVQFSCVWLCVDCSTPGLPVHHQLPELAQAHVHWVMMLSNQFHPLSPPSPPAFNLSWHQGLFQWVSSSHPEKAMAPHSSTLAWKIPWMEEPGRLQSIGLLRVRHDQVTSFMHWKRKWQPTPVILPGESQGRGSLVGCHLWGRTDYGDMTEAT